MRRRSALLALLGLLAVSASSSFGEAGAATSQFTLFNHTGSQTATSYYDPPFSAPGNWVSPVNYAAGRTYWRLEIESKPSSLAIQAQVCFWRNNHKVETCAPRSKQITDEGTYWIAPGSPNSWWKKNGNWNWAIPFDDVRIMVKDVASGRLLIGKSCGSYCYPRNDLGKHVPIRMDSEFVVVAPGATLDPPADWTGCPPTWSPACSGGGGGGTGVRVSIGNGSVTEPDSGSVSLPFKLSLSQKSTSQVTVAVKVGTGTATPGTDFSTRGGSVTVSFAPGETAKWVGFPVYGDTVKEPNETVVVNLANPTGATIGDGSAVGTIINDD